MLIQDERIKSRIERAEKVAVLTGAGISAESGIPTFRGENGIWNKLSPQELASFEAFYRNTAMVVEWYRQRRAVIMEAKPNPGHLALAEMEKIFPDFTLITQNIDRLHQRAGSQKVIELHGNIMENYCIRCGKHYTIDEFDGILESAVNGVPHCDCGGLIRPNVVWFGEKLPEKALEEAFESAENAEIFFSIGTSGQVRPAADLPFIAHQSGAILIEVNKEKTIISNFADLSILGEAGVILPQICEEIKIIRSSI